MRITLAVISFMVLYYGCSYPFKCVDRAKDLISYKRMGLYNLIFVNSQCAFFMQNRSGYPYLSYIMENSCMFKNLEFFVVKTDKLAQFKREVSYPFRMAFRISVICLKGINKRVNS